MKLVVVVLFLLLAVPSYAEMGIVYSAKELQGIHNAMYRQCRDGYMRTHRPKAVTLSFCVCRKDPSKIYYATSPGTDGDSEGLVMLGARSDCGGCKRSPATNVIRYPR